MGKQKDWAIVGICAFPREISVWQEMVDDDVQQNYLEKGWGGTRGSRWFCGDHCSVCPVWQDRCQISNLFDINRFYYSFSPSSQTHLMKPNTKMLTLFTGEKKAKISFTQKIPPAGIRQTSIASFFALQPGMVARLGIPREQKGTRACSYAGRLWELGTPAHCVKLSGLIRRGCVIKHNKTSPLTKQYVHTSTNIFSFQLIQSSIKYLYFLAEQWGEGCTLGVGVCRWADLPIN